MSTSLLKAPKLQHILIELHLLLSIINLSFSLITLAAEPNYTHLQLSLITLAVESTLTVKPNYTCWWV